MNSSSTSTLLVSIIIMGCVGWYAMGCDYYTVDESGEFKIEVRVECGNGDVKTETLSVDVPEDSKIYVDENIGDYMDILSR